MKVRAMLRRLKEGVFDVLTNMIKVGVKEPAFFIEDKLCIFIQYLPSDITDSKGKYHVVKAHVHADLGRAADDICGYKSIDGAITDIEVICSSLLEYVVPENLFLIFSDKLEFLHDFIADFPFPDLSLNPSPHYLADLHNQEHYGNKQRNRKNVGILLLKFQDSHVLKPLFRNAKEENQTNDCTYKFTWREFEKFLNMAKRKDHEEQCKQ